MSLLINLRVYLKSRIIRLLGNQIRVNDKASTVDPILDGPVTPTSTTYSTTKLTTEQAGSIDTGVYINVGVPTPMTITPIRSGYVDEANSSVWETRIDKFIGAYHGGNDNDNYWWLMTLRNYDSKGGKIFLKNDLSEGWTTTYCNFYKPTLSATKGSVMIGSQNYGVYTYSKVASSPIPIAAKIYTINPDNRAKLMFSAHHLKYAIKSDFNSSRKISLYPELDNHNGIESFDIGLFNTFFLDSTSEVSGSELYAMRSASVVVDIVSLPIRSSDIVFLNIVNSHIYNIEFTTSTLFRMKEYNGGSATAVRMSVAKTIEKNESLELVLGSDNKLYPIYKNI